MVLGLFCKPGVVKLDPPPPSQKNFALRYFITNVYETHELHSVIGLLIDGITAPAASQFILFCFLFCQDDTKFGATTPKPLMHV